MADKYLRRDGTTGVTTETEATVTSAGAGNAGAIVALDAGGKLDMTVLPTGVGADTVVVVASEALSAGNLVNLYDDSGTTKARKADGSTTGKVADGFVLAAVDQDATATVYRAGDNDQVTGLTPGKVWLSTTAAGGVQSTVPAGAGKTHQYVGYAATATLLCFERGEPITLA